ncbi:MAG: nucleotidyltransferase family protein, partial [Oscillospiraceae bacterium]|nr:nucleotidyltransferase family protein [Oscillospiraceae bacterium]
TLEKETGLTAGKRGYHDVSLTNSRIRLELHFSIKEGIESIDQMLERAWDYAVPTRTGHCYTFNPEFQIFQVLAHMCHHLKKSGLGMRPFIDLWLLRKKTAYDEKKLREMCRHCGILTFYEKSCDLSDSWMEAREYTPETKALEQYCLMGGVYGNTEIACTAVLRQNTGIRYYLRRLFIKKGILQEAYPELRNKPFLLPYYQIKRWFNLRNRKKRAKIIRELKGVKDIRREQIDSFDKLLVSLGL